MKIIEPSARLIDDINPEEILRKLELCGRVSHQSEPKGNPEQFIRMLIKRGHESVLEHVSLTFHIICDRAIMAELTRHRLAAFTVESTRYVKYNTTFAVIKPDFTEGTSEKTCYQIIYDDDGETIFEEIPDQYTAWQTAIAGAENIYNFLIHEGARPETARAVLPQCLKSKLYMTANLRELRHILKLRTDKAAHPQMRVIANQIFDVLKEKLPVIVEDINHE